MIISVASGKKHRDINYYERKFNKPTCPQPYHREEKIVEAINIEARKILVDENILAWLEQELVAEKEDSIKSDVRIKKGLLEKVNKLEARLKQLAIMRADKELGKDEYLDLRVETMNDLNSIKTQIAEIEASSIDIEGQIEITIDLVSKLRDKWGLYSYEEKAEILNIMTKKIELGKSGRNKVKIVWDKPWDMLYKFYPSIEINGYARKDSNSDLLIGSQTVYSV